MNPESNSDSKLDFEEAYRELGEIITQLEEGDLSLDESVRLYERGRTLTALCESLLDKAELRISRLSGAPNTGTHLEPFDEERNR
ncbi:MAG: exodeoxyribonuclease VII small subunit [Anaerolinea sp.]|nr:exodeoxyribonuclease VII small subunit [Anaerolinea sp.]MCC6974434.1 exodeoxyribonuclease VII small subunit [Anaerolineae bacterium]CAG0984731.1 Exodeoxyribonuclease 7 small subunit [Anaerolineae bacterium]